MQERIANYCKRLKLSKNVSEIYKDIQATNYEEFLCKLLELEVNHRNITKIERSIKLASFPVIRTFEDYSFQEITLPSSLREEELKELKFIIEKKNLILYGGVGTGKTHMACALGLNACNEGKNVKFYRTSTLVNQLSEAKKKGNLGSFLKRFEKLDLLILDEWGYVPLDREGAQLIFQIISDCYERCSIILTTNLEFSRWVSILYDENMTAALIDRLVHHSHLVLFNGSSKRLKELGLG
ncbi:IS21-like element helper ATPase IstB [Cetobacterium sp.]